MLKGTSMSQPHLRLRVKELAQARGWTIDTLAREVGLSTSQMGRLFQNRSQPSYTTAWQIARILNVAIEDLAIEDRAIEDCAAVDHVGSSG
jgi:transcriptional regulator with XRE-family HTH domain